MNGPSIDRSIKIVLWVLLIPVILWNIPYGQLAGLYFGLPLLALLGVLLLVKFFLRNRLASEVTQTKSISFSWILRFIAIAFFIVIAIRLISDFVGQGRILWFYV